MRKSLSLYLLGVGVALSSTACAHADHTHNDHTDCCCAHTHCDHAASGGGLTSETGFPVDINQPLRNNDINANPNKKPLIITAWCNSTRFIKVTEGLVGNNQAATVQDIVVSESGTDRHSITFVVPWDWHYRVHESYNLDGSDYEGFGPNHSCKAAAWAVGD